MRARPLIVAATATVALALPTPAMADARVSVSNDKGSTAIDPTYATTLTLRGSGFQSITNGHGGIYVFFGTVKGSWRPSQGGQTGEDLFYVPDSEDKNNAGYQKYVSFPGSDTASSANGGSLASDGTWSTKIKVPGATFKARDRNNDVTTIDCRKVTCGVITVGAHGVKNANNETFTPVSVKSLYGSSSATPTPSASASASASDDDNDSPTITATDEDPAAEEMSTTTPELDVDRSSAIAGNSMPFSAVGLRAGDQVVATLDNGVVSVGPLPVGQNGQVAGVIELPAKINPGTHRLRLAGTAGSPTVTFGIAAARGDDADKPIAAIAFAGAASLLLLASAGFAAWRLRTGRGGV